MGRNVNGYKEWRVPLKSVGDFNKGSRKFGYRMVQEGTTSFGRKKKNGCKLVSRVEIQRDQRRVVGLPDKVRMEVQVPNGVVRAVKVRQVAACQYAWPKIKIK